MKSPRQWFQQLFHQKRRVFINQGRIHLELRDITLDQLGRLEKLYRPQACALDGVYWCVYNQALHRFVIAFQPEKGGCASAEVAAGSVRTGGGCAATSVPQAFPVSR